MSKECKIYILYFVLYLFLSGTAQAELARLYGQADAVWAAKLSPDGAHIALGCSPSGAPAVCIYDLKGQARPRIFYPGDDFRVENFYWADKAYIVTNVVTTKSIKTRNGLRTHDLKRAISYSLKTGKHTILMKDAGNWNNLTRLIDICQSRPGKILMGIRYVPPTRRRSTGTRLGHARPNTETEWLEVDLRTGRSKKFRRTGDLVIQSLLDDDCQPFIDVIYNDRKDIFKISLSKENRTLYERKGAEIRPLYVMGSRLNKKHLIVWSDDEDLHGLYSLSLSDGTLEPLRYEGVELGEMGILEDIYTRSVIGFKAVNLLKEHYYIEDELREIQTKISGNFPNAVTRVSSFDMTRTLFTLEIEQPGHATEFYLFDKSKNELSPLGMVTPQLEGLPRPVVTAKSYQSSDGLTIPVFLTLPPGKEIKDGPLPGILMPHGGPEARDTAAYDWWAQAYAEAGFAVIQPNFRGSSGYGNTFRNAGFGEFGDKMIDDIVEAISWAEKEGFASETGMCIAGASYGGYAALMAGLRQKDKIGCIVAVAPVTDIFTHMARYERNSEPYDYWSRYVGADIFAPEAEKKRLSPARRAREYNMPVLLIHGKSDLVVTQSQSKQFEREWGARPGLTVHYMAGQDHFLRTTEARHTLLEHSLDFLQTHHPALK